MCSVRAGTRQEPFLAEPGVLAPPCEPATIQRRTDCDLFITKAKRAIKGYAISDVIG